MSIDLSAAVARANQALEVAKDEKRAPFVLKPLAQDAIALADDVVKLRRALEDVLGYAVDAWDETDIDGSYQTTGFRDSIERALALLPDASGSEVPK